MPTSLIAKSATAEVMSRKEFFNMLIKSVRVGCRRQIEKDQRVRSGESRTLIKILECPGNNSYVQERYTLGIREIHGAELLILYFIFTYNSVEYLTF